MKNIVIVLSFLLLVSCGSTSTSAKKNKKETGPTVFDDAYYQDLQKNIVRLHHLMQGTFIAHTDVTDAKLKAWNVSGGDSVVLYSVPLGEVAKDGYWTYSYEFMTSLPDDPIYSSIKQIKQISRDTLEVLYWKDKTKTKLTLKEVLDQKVLNEKIKFENLVQREKRVLYVRKSSANFLGLSGMYVDKEFDCLRQNAYDVSPSFYKVQTTFYDEKTKEPLERKKRPNLLVRRDMSLDLLHKIASKEDLEEEK